MQDGFQLRRSTFSGLVWSAGGQLGNQVLVVLITMVLARLLSPAQFGTIAMITVFTGYASILVNFGFNAAIIQKKDLTDTDKNTAFWMTVLIGLIVTGLISLSAPLISSVYSVPELTPLTIVVSSTFLFGSLVVVQNALFARNMDFKRIAMRNVFSTLIGGGAGIALALSGWGVWSLALQSVTGAVALVFLVWGMSDWRPGFQFSSESLKKLSPLSLNIFFNQSLAYFVNNIDNFVIGKLFGQASLGIYSRSYSITSLPTLNITRVFTSVLLPAFSKISEEEDRIRKAYLRLNKVVATLSIPIMTIMLVQAEAFIRVILGPKWDAAAPIVRIFCVSGMISSINSIVGSVLIAKLRNDLIFWGTVTKRPSVFIGIIAGVFWGPIGVAVGRLASDVFSYGVSIWQLNSALSLSLRTQIGSLIPVITASVVGGSAVYWLAQPVAVSYHFNLILQIAMGTAVFFLLAIPTVFILDRKETLEMLGLLAEVAQIRK